MSGMGLSFSELCCLFCCPPCPSRIAAKLAFLPPEPTYSFEEETVSETATTEPGNDSTFYTFYLNLTIIVTSSLKKGLNQPLTPASMLLTTYLRRRNDLGNSKH
jgi:hypothetical protein